MNRGARLKAALICGAGHSGSTLLGMILGSHSSGFFMGEGGKVRYLGDETKPLRKRACKICGPACPVWGDFRWNHAEALYNQVARRVGRDLIVDSTKDEEWITARVAETRAAGGQPHLLMLLRDGRAVVNSRLRKYPHKSPEQVIQDHFAKMQRAQALYDAFDGPKLRVRYEHLATNTENTVRSLCELLQIPYEPSMLHFHRTEHHPLGGNNGPQFIAARARATGSDSPVGLMSARSREYYENHGETIRLDLRWRQELSPDVVALFDRIGGHQNNDARWGD